MLFGAFRPSGALSGGLLWKIPWRLSGPQKRRQRERLRAVDDVVATLTKALTMVYSSPSQSSGTAAASSASSSSDGMILPKSILRWYDEMPSEAQMRPKDKYTVFDRKARGYRKGVHKIPKWTRISQRVNPPGF